MLLYVNVCFMLLWSNTMAKNVCQMILRQGKKVFNHILSRARQWCLLLSSIPSILLWIKFLFYLGQDVPKRWIVPKGVGRGNLKRLLDIQQDQKNPLKSLCQIKTYTWPTFWMTHELYQHRHDKVLMIQNKKKLGALPISI